MLIALLSGLVAVCFAAGVVGVVRVDRAARRAFVRRVEQRGLRAMRGHGIETLDGNRRVSTTFTKHNTVFQVQVEGHPLGNRLTFQANRQVSVFGLSMTAADVLIGDQQLDDAWWFRSPAPDVLRGVMLHPGIAAALATTVDGHAISAFAVDGRFGITFVGLRGVNCDVEALERVLAAGVAVSDAFAEARDAVATVAPGANRSAGREGSSVGIPSMR